MKKLYTIVNGTCMFFLTSTAFKTKENLPVAKIATSTQVSKLKNVYLEFEHNSLLLLLFLAIV